MFGALEFSDKLSGRGHPADRRLRARRRFRRPGGAAPSRARAEAAAPRPAGGARGRLPQPDAADLARLPRHARRASRRTSSSPRLSGAAGLIALTGGPGGPLDLALAAGQAELAAARCERLARAVRRPALCRAAAPRAAGGEAARAGAARSRLHQGHCRSSPPTSRSIARREDFEAHDALICIAEGRLIAESERRQLTPGALLQVARRDGGAVRRPARGARLDGRDRAALRLPAEDAQADPAALHGARTAPRSTRRRSCAARPRKG